MTTKPCPYCAEEINTEAKKCKHCGEFLDADLRKEKGLDDYDINFYANYWYLPKKQNRNKSNKHPKEFLEGIGMTDRKLSKLYIDTDLLNFHRYTTFIKNRSSMIKNYVSTNLDIQESDYKVNEDEAD